CFCFWFYIGSSFSCCRSRFCCCCSRFYCSSSRFNSGCCRWNMCSCCRALLAFCCCCCCCCSCCGVATCHISGMYGGQRFLKKDAAQKGGCGAAPLEDWQQQK